MANSRIISSSGERPTQGQGDEAVWSVVCVGSCINVMESIYMSRGRTSGGRGGALRVAKFGIAYNTKTRDVADVLRDRWRLVKTIGRSLRAQLL